MCLQTLFLWYCAFPEAHRGLTAHELAEACLAEDETIKQEDLIHGIILQRLRELSQVEYTNKERGAFFRVSAVSGPTYTEILARHQRRVDDDSEAAPQWLSLLMAPPSRTDGVSMLFGGQTLDRREKVTGRANKVRYDGERVVVGGWSKAWGGPVVDSTDYAQHFQLVYVREPVSVAAQELADDRVAVIVPASWKEVAREEMRRYCATLRVEKEYAAQQGPDAEEIRRANNAKKQEILLEIQRRQHEAYRRGQIITRAGLGIDPRQVFAVPERADDLIASALLAHAYRQPLFDHEAFRRELSSTELGRVYAVLLQGSSVTADVGAVDNYGRGLGLVSEEKPRELDPVQCAFFNVIRTELAQADGDLNLRSFYEKYTGVPYGVPVDLLSLYLLTFVRFAQPACSLAIKPEASFTLKTGRPLRGNRLGFADVPMVTWNRRLHRFFDRLVQLQGPGWNDFVEYFRELDETLQATTAPEQVMAQQERLGKVLTEWSSKIEAIRKRLMGLARDLEQDISEAVAVMDALGAVCQKTEPHDLQTFADIFAEQFERDGQKFKSAVATSRRLEELDRIYVQPLAEAVRYLEHIEGLPQADPLMAERTRARAMVDLQAFCMDPSAAETALQAFRQFHDAYKMRYLQHYSSYRSALVALNLRLKGLGSCVQGLARMNQVKELGAPTGRHVVDTYYHLLKQTETAHLQEDYPDVDKRPIVDGVRLDTEPPMAEVAQFEKDLDEALLERLELLSAPAIWDMLACNTDADVQTLVAAIDVGDPVQTASTFTDIVADRVQTLFRQARVLIVEVRLSDYGPVQLSDESDDLRQAVQGFERFLRARLEEARRVNPGKIVRLNLK